MRSTEDSDVTMCAKALKCLSSSGGGISKKYVSRPVSITGGTENYDV